MSFTIYSSPYSVCRGRPLSGVIQFNGGICVVFFGGYEYVAAHYKGDDEDEWYFVPNNHSEEKECPDIGPYTYEAACMLIRLELTTNA